MNRRQFALASLGTVLLGVSGCLDNGESSEPDGGSDDTNGGNDEENGGSNNGDENGGNEDENEDEPYIDPDSMDGLNPLEYDVSVDSGATEENPITIDLELTNTGEETYDYGERRAAMFWESEGNESFSLYPHESVEELYEYDNEVWWLAEPFATTDDFQVESLEPDETHTEELVVLHTPVDDEDALEDLPGELEFQTEFSFVEDSAEKEVVDEDSNSWGFTTIVAEDS